MKTPLFVRWLTLLTVSVNLWSAGAAPAASPPSSDPVVTALVVLEGEPVAALAGTSWPRSRVARAGLAPAARARAAALQRQHVGLHGPLAEHGARVVSEFTRLVNAVKVRVPRSRMEGLAGLPGVVRVQLAPRYKRALAQAVPFVGAPALWAAAGASADGAGVRVGIIDSGIDYTHAMFGGSGKAADYDANDPTRIEPGTFPTAKVVGGWDFVGDDYDAGTDAHGDPHPDPDPLDCGSNGHGSHVAGIVAGFGVTAADRTYVGPYTAELAVGDFHIGPGVAPRALLYALKVFGCDGSTDATLEALEWAADPDGDHDFSDRLDVVNLSLGIGFGQVIFDNLEAVAVDRLVALGCVVAVAAGNDGNSFFITSTPGSAARAITVAHSTSRAEGPAIEVKSPAAIAAKYFAVEGVITYPLRLAGAVEARLVYVDPARACGDLVNASAVRDQVALIDRGDCLFSDKVRRAQDAGARAVVMVNNQDAAPIPMGGTAEGITIPGVMISRADGALIKAQLTNGIEVTVRLASDLRATRPEFLDTIADTSSRGPSSAGYLKPDLTAPGTLLTSAMAGRGITGVAYSGTSMATPMVAGAAALLRQLHPTWTPEEIKAALMNTAQRTVSETGQAYPESRTGAGRLQVDAAAGLAVTAAAAEADGRVSVSFGPLAFAAAGVERRAIQLTNHSAAAIAFEVAVSNTVAQAGVTYTLSTNRLTLPAHGATTVELRLAADPARFAPALEPTTPGTQGTGTLYPRQALAESSGQVWFLAATQTLHVPFHASVRATSELHATPGRVTLTAAHGTNAVVPLALPLAGTSAHPLPLVAAFQLGATSPRIPFTDPYRAAADLLAMGAATDIATAETVTNATLFFGIATARSWASPQRSLVAFEVEVDSDLDGRADFRVYNDNATATNLFNAEDVLVSVVQQLDARGNPVTTEGGGYLNVWAADEADTAPFWNSVMVLPAPARLLGLSDAQPRFRYRVVSYDPSPFSGRIDYIPWMPFNAARPVVDTAAGGSPWFLDGEPVEVMLDRAAAAENGLRQVEVLLLHAHNPEGARLDLVTLELGDDDTDGDRLPDWWERRHFGNLTTAGKGTDTDGDDMDDPSEFRAGTDPAEPGSKLKVFEARWVAGRGLVLRWASAAGRLYRVERATDLTTGFDMQVGAGLYATPPENEFVDLSATSGQTYFYRVGLQP